MIQPNLIAL